MRKSKPLTKRVRERRIEAYVVRKVKAAGGVAKKLKGTRNDPDRLCLFPGAGLCFVETKAPGKKARAGQAREHARLWRLGFRVLIVDSYALADEFVRQFSKG